jgi:hypothetical protein
MRHRLLKYRAAWVPAAEQNHDSHFFHVTH